MNRDDELDELRELLADALDRITALECAVFDGDMHDDYYRPIVNVPGPDTWEKPVSGE